MQAIQEYKNYAIIINNTGDRTIVQAYSKSVPVKQLTADTIQSIKHLIDEETDRDILEINEVRQEG